MLTVPSMYAVALPDPSTGSSVTATPAATTTYTVTGTSALGCTSTATVVVTVNPLVTPLFNAIGTLCQNAIAPALPPTSTNGAEFGLGRR